MSVCTLSSICAVLAHLKVYIKIVGQIDSLQHKLLMTLYYTLALRDTAVVVMRKLDQETGV